MQTRGKRMTTGVERHFKPVGEGLYREVVLYFIIFKDDEGNVISNKLDKTIEGRLFKEVKPTDRMTNQERVLYKFPSGDEKLLVVL
jgi:hypothetical protein